MATLHQVPGTTRDIDGAETAISAAGMELLVSGTGQAHV
jgi:hypothetical protein